MARMTAEELMRGMSADNGGSYSVSQPGYQPYDPDSKDPVERAIGETQKGVQLSAEQHKSRLATLLREQAAGKQKAKKTSEFFTEEYGRAEVGLLESIAKPFIKAGATVEEGLMRPMVGAKPRTTEEVAAMPEVLRPHETKTDALLGTGEIGLALLPETAEFKALFESANAYLKQRRMLGLGMPKVGTKAAEEAAAKLSGKVLQPKTTEAAAKAAKGLELVDTAGVKTYDDLVKAGDAEITKLAQAVDKRLAANTLSKLPEAMAPEDQLFIKAALNDMGNVYSKTRSPADVRRISGLVQKFESEGLTAKEINDIAREYGTTFKSKAFRADKTPATSWTGEGYENTRQAVKNAARNQMPDETTKKLDEAMSKVYAMKDHAAAEADEVLKLKNKTVPANAFKKIMDTIGKPVAKFIKATGVPDIVRDIFSLGAAGDETLSAIELEASLAKDLARLRKLQGLEGTALSDELIRMAEEAAAKQAAETSAMKALPEGAAPGSPENPIVGSARGATPVEPRPGAVATEPPPDTSGPFTPERPAAAEREAGVKAINQILQKANIAGDFPIDTSRLMEKNGGYFIIRSGASPTRISKLESMFLEQAGYKFTPGPPVK